MPGTPEAEALAEAIIEPYGDISDSPYTSFPADVEGPVVFVNVDTRTVDEAYRVVAAAAIAHGFHILDPQLGELFTADQMRVELAAHDVTHRPSDGPTSGR